MKLSYVSMKLKLRRLLFVKKSNNFKLHWHEENGKIIIPLHNNFDFKANLGYLRRSEDECMYVVEDDVVTTVISGAGKNLLTELTVNGINEMVVTILNETITKNEKAQEIVVKYIYEWFDLDYDIEPFYAMAEADPLLKKAVKEYYGLRLCGVPNLFEALCWGIIGQQINLAFAYKLKKQFVEQFGNYILWDDQKYWIFPTFDDIANLTIADFDNIKLTTRKKEYLLGVAQLMSSGELTKEQLQATNNLRDAEKVLTSIRGIGPWTANYVLMRCLRFPDAYPIADVGLHNAIKSLKNSAEKPSRDELRDLSDKWHPHQSYATFYLWRTIY